MNYISINSPVGFLTLFEQDDAITVIEWGRISDPIGSPLLTEAKRQLNAYFDRDLETFDLPLNPQGTPFQKAVWDGMLKIPYGQTQTYGELASQVGSAARAVGGACGRNPIPIVIPCHRVTGANGKLTGFSGGEGVQTKQQLLAIETKQLL